MTRRLLFVHAHPDDESSKGAATAARYVDEGAEVVLVTCTDGAAGEVLNPAFAVPEGATMADVRREELAVAVAAIGFTRTHALGHPDSGYHLDPADVPAGTFSRLPVDRVAAELADILRRERPHVVVTYAEDGGYPHPDHIMVHLVTMRAVELAGSPEHVGDGRAPWSVATVHATSAFPRERLEALHGAMLERGLESPFAEWLEGLPVVPPRAPHTRVRVEGHLERRDAALRAHASQIDPDGRWFAVPRDLEVDAYPYEAYDLVATRVWTSPEADDLFAGIDPDVEDAVAGPDAGGGMPVAGDAVSSR
jgi:mycothiol S-conjugate amidase